MQKYTDIIQKQERLKAKRKIELISKNCDAITAHTKESVNAIVYAYQIVQNQQITLLAVGFKGRTIKPTFHFKFKSTEKRKAYIDRFFETTKSQEEQKEIQKEKQKEQRLEQAGKIKIGSIFTGSWGYEQTNREFYQVIDKMGTYKVVIRALEHQLIKGSEGFDCCEVKPVIDGFKGESVTKIITRWGISFEHFTLRPCDPNKGYYKSWGY